MHKGEQFTVDMWYFKKSEVRLRLKKFLRPRIILIECGLNLGMKKMI